MQRANEVQQVAGRRVYRPGAGEKAEVLVWGTHHGNGYRSSLKQIGQGSTRHELSTRLIRRRLHRSRSEDAFDENAIKWLVLDDLDYARETSESGATIKFRAARLEEQAFRLDSRH